MSKTRLIDEWTQQAACVNMPSRFFFPERGSSSRWEELTYAEERAKAVCLRCPVRTECLTYAVTPKVLKIHPEGAIQRIQFEDMGVWGGTLPRERRKHWSDDTKATVKALTKMVDEQAKERGLV